MAIDVGRVGMIPLESIIIGERARQEMGDLNSLEGSMKESGLSTPLTFKDNGDGTFTLLAGGRRFVVLKRNSTPLIPARIYEKDLTELEIKMIEKAENFHRKDFEYYELDKLTAEIHAEQQALKGVKAPGPGQSGWSATNTAELIGAKSPASVTEAIRRAEAREAFPELFENCKSAFDATKVLKKVDEAVIKQVLAQKIETQKVSNGSILSLAKYFIIKDFFIGVREIPEGRIHLVEIDPPYAIDLKDKKKREGESQYMLEDYNEVEVENYQAFISKVLKECYRVMAPHSWLICWFAPEPWFEVIYREINNAGFNTTRMCGIWPKGFGQSLSPSTRLANTYEMFFYAWKGQPALNKAGHGNEFRVPPIPPNQKTHPTERPIPLMKEIYDTFAFPGSNVLIPFLGSGNGLISAYELGMQAVGFELGKSHKDSFLVKLNGMQTV